MKFVDLKGLLIGRLTVVEMVSRDKKTGQSIWKCVCGCGKETTVIYSHLRGKRPTQSCGCMARGTNRARLSSTHGMSKSPEYTSFAAAKKRCTNSNAKQFADYGGRGIRFHFSSFEEFYAEIGPRPEPKLNYSLERIDNEGHYEKGNVKWATKKQQARNRRCDTCASRASLELRIAELEKKVNALIAS